jgi:hypothetical protein
LGILIVRVRVEVEDTGTGVATYETVELDPVLLPGARSPDGKSPQAGIVGNCSNRVRVGPASTTNLQPCPPLLGRKPGHSIEIT